MKHINEYIDNNQLKPNEQPVNEFLATCLAIIGTVLFAKGASRVVNATGDMVEDFWDWTLNYGEHQHSIKNGWSEFKSDLKSLGD